MYSRSLNDESHLLRPHEIVVTPRRSHRYRRSTRDSQDSGIASRASSAHNGHNVDPVEDYDDYILFRKNRKLQIDDVLWFICFGIMLLVFKLPYRLWFDHRVNWYFLHGCFVAVIIFHLLGLYIRLALRFKRNPHRSILKPIATTSFITSGLFNLATLPFLVHFYGFHHNDDVYLGYIDSITF